MSYTRGQPDKPPQQQQQQRSSEQQREENEDQRFLRLARDALVATAQGVSGHDNQLVDPTISDLLTRLQYASSPHGNPISQSEKIKADNEGKLMIQGFYSQFPNLSNDIFTGSTNRPKQTENYGGLQTHNPSGDEEGWNFLIGDSGGRSSSILESSSRTQSISLSRKSSSAGDNSENPSRKFLCDKCSMSFRRSSDLKRHEKQHLSIPPNICELCGKGFARKDALKRHMGTLTCKRNSEKKLYIDNLNYLGKRGSNQITEEGEEGDDDEEEEEENEEETREGGGSSSNRFSKYHSHRSDWDL
ncbi:Transcriptional regulator MET32 [Spathaspora sp. JA1]|nr:Transcriptional regulator MET32 [Spathaspora sp. JA1]